MRLVIHGKADDVLKVVGALATRLDIELETEREEPVPGNVLLTVDVYIRSCDELAQIHGIELPYAVFAELARLLQLYNVEVGDAIVATERRRETVMATLHDVLATFSTLA
jgi:hypothetical protein